MRCRGKGVACMVYGEGSRAHPSPSAAMVRIAEDGTVVVQVGAVDNGQGARTVLSQIAAEELGVPVSDIRIVTGDTWMTPYDHGAVTSRQTAFVGSAVKEAALKAKNVLFEFASRQLDVPISSLVSRGGRVYVSEYPEKGIPFRRLAEKAIVDGYVAMGVGSFAAPVIRSDAGDSHGMPYSSFVFATQIAEVEVDTDTGWVDVIKVTAVHDCGRAVNPMLAEGQVEGAVAMGVGFACMEELLLSEDGTVLNPGFRDYIVPTTMDVPEIDVVLLDNSFDEMGPYGAKGIGEPAILPTAPAIVNAIYDAVGIWITDLPITPEKILRELGRKREESDVTDR